VVIEEMPWGIEPALAIFFGGLGGGSFIIASYTSYVSGEKFREIMKFASYVGVVSSILCILFFSVHAGHPERAFNLYANFPSSMISFGSTVLSLIIPLGIVYTSFLPPESLPFLKSLMPWHANLKARKLLEALMFILGVCLVAYTSFVLALAKVNAFWESPLIVLLFFVSGVSTASMAVGLCLAILYHAQYTVASKKLYMDMMHYLDVADSYMLPIELVVALAYVYVMLRDPFTAARLAATAVAYGQLSGLFWGGFIGLGLVVPIILLMLLTWRGKATVFAKLHVPLTALTSVLVLVGGAVMRYVIVVAGQIPMLIVH